MLSETSNPLPGKLMSFVPNAQTSEIVLFVRLISAMALFSCKVTHAFWESALMVMYSGSKSWDKVLVDFNFLTFFLVSF